MMRTVRPYLVTLLAAATLGVMGISSATAATSTTSRGLARRLDAAKLCVRVGSVRGRVARQFGGIGVHGAWRCVAHRPTDGSTGATTIVTWAAPSARRKRHAIAMVNTGFRNACAEPANGVSGSSDDPGQTRPAGPHVSTQYVVGPDWVAFVQVNAPVRRVAAVLHGHPVTKECE
jgi:hypothetical protein